MSLAELKEHMLLPEQEIVISRAMLVRGKKVLIASITKEGNECKLWVFYEMPEQNTGRRHILEHETNRESIRERVSLGRNHFIHIRAITLQGQELRVAGSSGRRVGQTPMSWMLLQHFTEAGVDFSSLADIDPQALALGEYRLAEGTAFPTVDPGAAISVVLLVGEEHRESLVKPGLRITLPLGEQQGCRREFVDMETGDTIGFYLNSLTCYDVWAEYDEEEARQNLGQSRQEHGLDGEEITAMVSEHKEAMEKLCPRDCRVLMLHYEAEGDAQLCFHTKDYLDSPPESNEDGSIGIIFSSGEQQSRHGHRCRPCNLGAVPAGYARETEIELVSWYRIIPGEELEA